MVRLPAAEHARRGKDGLPLVRGPIRTYLDGQVPDGLTWEVTPDRELTADHAASTPLRTAYADVPDPFELALMPLRIDGAAELDPRAEVWKWEEHLLVGTVDLWLCNDPDRPTSGWWSASECGQGGGGGADDRRRLLFPSVADVIGRELQDLSAFNILRCGPSWPAYGWLPGCLGEGWAWADMCGGWLLSRLRRRR
ncbi:hypothetical protein AB0J57_32305 [Streptomyces sp. NPDC049837]|uniref:hypothetical protein n=1 Tax=Streptomyces sp. NPDC049837 TaxID=3155277 RepID=UPI003435748A